jgi:hypothetical protein
MMIERLRDAAQFFNHTPGRGEGPWEHGWTAAYRPGEAGTRADSVVPFPQDRRRRVSHGGNWAPNVVQLPEADPKAGRHDLFTVAQVISIRYGSVLGSYTFHPRPPARPVVLVGHSFGGAVVIAAGAVTPHVAGVVALAPQT